MSKALDMLSPSVVGLGYTEAKCTYARLELAWPLMDCFSSCSVLLLVIQLNGNKGTHIYTPIYIYTQAIKQTIICPSLGRHNTATYANSINVRRPPLSFHCDKPGPI